MQQLFCKERENTEKSLHFIALLSRSSASPLIHFISLFKNLIHSKVMIRDKKVNGSQEKTSSV